MTNEIEIQTTVKGGLPVLAIMDYDPEDHDVGFFKESISQPFLYWLSGKEITSKVYQTIPDSDFHRIMQEGLESKHNVGQY